MGVIQCRNALRSCPYQRPASATLLYCPFQSPYIPYGFHFHDRNPGRHSATCGLKAQRPSTSCRCRSAKLLLPRRNPFTTTTSSSECCCVRSGAFGGCPPSRATEFVQ